MLLACCLTALMVCAACPAQETTAPAGPLEGLVQRMLAGQWDAYGEIAAQSPDPQTPYCKLEGYPDNLDTGYCWPSTITPWLRAFPPDRVCGFYMLSTGTPVRSVLGVDWLAKELGVNRDELLAEEDALAKRGQPIAPPAPRLPRLVSSNIGLNVGNTSYELPDAPQQAFSYDGARIEYWEATSARSLTPLDLLYVDLDEATAEKLLRQDVKYQDYLSYASSNKPASLKELADLMAGQGAAGILQQFDFSEFELSVEAPPPDRRQAQGTDWQQLVYILGAADDLSKFKCLLRISGDDSTAELRFTPAWLAEAGASPADEFNRQFDELYTQGDGGGWLEDSPRDALDAQLQAVQYGDVMLSRKTYGGPDGNGQVVASITHPASASLFTPELLKSADWLSTDNLPAASANPGALERLIREVCTTPAYGMADKLGLVRRENESGLVLPANCYPNTVNSIFELPDTGQDKAQAAGPAPAACSIYCDDDVYTWSMDFNPAWFEARYGVSAEDLAAQFDALFAAFEGQTGRRGSGPQQLTMDNFKYGKAAVKRTVSAGEPPEGFVDYLIWPYSWNSLVAERAAQQQE